MLIDDLKKLLEDMSLEEKIGQMVQIHANLLTEGGILTGPTETMEMTDEKLALVGSILGKRGSKELHKVQKEFMEKQPHHIPLLFMYDVINGMETIFPIPLAQGCTFSEDFVEKAANVSAKEAAVSGLHATFSPMADLVRDARWGRVMESTGEDPWLNAQLGKAMVRGYQGVATENEGKADLKKAGKIAGCIKHFAGYGAPEGGRDYDNIELSERTFREDYLPAYKAAVEEGCAMVMTSFNTHNRIPSSGNKWLNRKILREEMGFDGVLISDYGAVEEMVAHGFAEDCKDAAKLAIHAGVDIDMVSNAYVKYLADLVRCGEVEECLVDEAVWRILSLKNDLGLFENPYKDGAEEKEAEILNCDEHRKLAREIAAASFVLLKNEEMLPLAKEGEEKIAFIGPYVDNVEIYGSWSFPECPERIVTVKQGVEKKKKKIDFVQGAFVMDAQTYTRHGNRMEYTEAEMKAKLEEAVKIANESQKVVLCLGEHRDQSGEAGSRTDISIPKNQMDLLRAVSKVNKNIITVLFSGRPLEMKEITELSKAVMIAWMPGSEGGNAIADVLFGDVAPEGRLAMCIPRSVGQVPIYYNQFMTGRPNSTGNVVSFINGYIDESTKPLYPFGYGLTYTKFKYSKVHISKKEMMRGEMLTAEVMVTNTGATAATETVQMYLRDVKGSVVRPVKMLRGIQKIMLQPEESKTVKFEISEDMLKFYDINMDYVSECGEFYVYIGHDSDTENMEIFELV